MTRQSVTRMTCDRCGEAQVGDHALVSIWHELNIKPEATPMRSSTDLCAACWEDFAIWWQSAKILPSG